MGVLGLHTLVTVTESSLQDPFWVKNNPGDTTRRENEKKKKKKDGTEGKKKPS